jgi:ABC-type sugar transport system ATPase subunit
MIMSNQPLVEIKNIHKSFGSLEVLKGVDFSLSMKEKLSA